MKRILFLTCLLWAAGLSVSPSAMAWYPGMYGGFGWYPPGFGYMGGPFFYPGDVSPNDYYYPPIIVTEPAQPQVYVEKSAPTAANGEATVSYYWYHCDSPEGYYPYITQCPAGWKAVAPTPKQ